MAKITKAKEAEGVLENAVKSQYWWRFVILIVITATCIIFWAEIKDESSVKDSDEFHHVYASTFNYQRCVDEEDPPEWSPEKKTACQCPDPSRAKPRNMNIWKTQHNTMVRAANAANYIGQELDFAMIGDSITERLMGTRGMGAKSAPEYKQVFDEFFNKSHAPSAAVRGLALGSSGDICTELKWHLENGILPDTLKPKAWIILIGTNDLDRSKCSKRNTLAGILNVAHYLHEKRPNTPIILHGLLPRADEFNTGDYTLGIRWKQIMWINRELKKFCAFHNDWHYMESNNLFLERNTDASAQVVINAERMEDSLHPSVEGYKVWAPCIVENVQQIINVKEGS